MARLVVADFTRFSSWKIKIKTFWCPILKKRERDDMTRNPISLVLLICGMQFLEVRGGVPLRYAVFESYMYGKGNLDDDVTESGWPVYHPVKNRIRRGTPGCVVSHRHIS